MSKKSFIIILVLSVIVTYGVAFIDALRSSTLLAGESGLPFKYSRGTLFGSGSINYVMMSVNIIFWFIVLWVIWKAIQKLMRQ